MRIGPSHQAGSDSLLTAATFFKMREIYFNDRIDDAEYNGKLFGLGTTATLAYTNGSDTNGISTPGAGGASGSGSLSVSSTMSGFGGAGAYAGAYGMGGAAMTAYSMRGSGATIAERERTPLQRDGSAVGQSAGQGAGGAGQGGVGPGPLPTPGLTGFSMGGPYGTVPNGPYMRQINVGGER